MKTEQEIISIQRYDTRGEAWQKIVPIVKKYTLKETLKENPKINPKYNFWKAMVKSNSNLRIIKKK